MIKKIADAKGAGEFIGYTHIRSEAKLNGILVNGLSVKSANAGDDVEIVLDRTPFYAEGAIAEPIAYRDLLVTGLSNSGIQLESWTRCEGSEVTQMYSQFIFVRTN